MVDNLNKNLGGCAGNIAYTMKLLGADPVVFAPLGKDSKEYMEHFKKLGLTTNYVPLIKEKNTSAAHITTDKDDNQIIAYYNGAADEAKNMSVHDVKEGLSLALITPTQKDAMIKHAKECHDIGIPIVFDPSHQLTAFSSQELMAVIGQAKFYIANDYEMKLTCEKTGWDLNELLNHVEVLITTLGEKGSVIMTKEQTTEVGICPPSSVEDPTGAGDAYRSGFFTAYTQGHDYKTCGQMGAVAASYAIEHYGTQNHSFSTKEFKERYEDVFEETIDLAM